MTLQELQQLYSQHPVIALVQRELKRECQHLWLNGLQTSARQLVLSCLDCQQLLIAPTADDAQYIASDLQAILNDEQVMLFPSAYRLHRKNRQTDESYEIQRTEVINKLSKYSNNSSQHTNLIIVTYPEAISDAVPEKDDFQRRKITLQKGQEITQDNLLEQLHELGFKRVDFVYEPGQMAVRGGIFDIFSYSHEEPYRLDFFGDEIDSIRLFNLETQLSKTKVEQIDIIAAPQADEQTTQAANIIDYLLSDTIVIAEDFGLVKMRLDSTLSTPIYEQITAFRTIETGNRSVFDNYNKLDFHTLPQPIFHKNFDLMIEALEDYVAKGYRLYLLTDSVKQADRIDAIMQEKNTAIQFLHIDHTLHEGFIDHDCKLVCLTDHQLFERFHKVGQKQDTARQGKVLLTLKELNQLQIGDYVVHVDHGIGRFGGLVKTPVGNRMQEMIKLIYRDNDILFVSIHSLHRISKYKGKDGGTAPNVSKLGSGAWERLKERTKQKVKDIARDLIQLYAARRKEQGFQYSPDSYMQHELEASFIYEDTPDQQKATIALKHDMESPIPMDRLICGDVGFGKTEIAIRAAFKAATDGKQVAVLVPTTVLALQHYNTFKERLAQFPVKIEYLSRAKSAKETKQILEQLARGEIDILIGTHKLVGKQVHFKDLGLLIIDEEQKFGVATKEKLRQLKVNVDTLTLTATPIPRTLQFSLLGARDLSVMTTPPPNRYPVQTELITPQDEDILQEAVREEIGRNGQIFVINNRIQTLQTVANKISRLCPEARVVTAHGQMPPEQVEQILTDFINYDYDVLVCTSIVESGVDIPNVNTIIINSAQMFGLSDLHQLRGRVGRSNRKAYCYLVAPEQELLTPDARRRLKAVETFTDLGSGFHIAMQDLDIRGAGNMLGAEQSGFIADLGYETYQRILNEAVIELRNEEFTDLFHGEQNTANNQTNTWVSDCQLDSDLEIGFPADYIENISERITLYRELDNIQDEKELLDFKLRLIDRFGILPQGAEELLSVVQLRWRCIALGIEKIVLKMNRMTIFFPQNPQSAYYQSETFGKIITYLVNHPRRCQLRDQNGKRSAVILNVKSIKEAWAVLNEI